MSYITTKDDVEIFYKDWGSKNAQPIVFHHGWPLSSDDWDAQMLFFLAKGYRVVAHDRRGHGRSTQTGDGHDMDHYTVRHGKGRVAKLVLIGAVPPLMLKTAANPGGLPIEVFDGFRQALAANRSSFYWDVPVPFYGFNRPGNPVQEPIRMNWYRQSMMGAVNAQYDSIKAFSETDFTEDL